MIRAAGLITAKDIRILLRTRTVLVLGLLAPLGLALVLNLVFGGADDPAERITFEMGLVDGDGGDVAEGFVDVLEQIGADGLLDVERFDGEQAARRAVDDGSIDGAWSIPPGFSSAVRSGAATEIVVIGDVDAPHTAAFARAVADRYAIGIGTSTLAATVAVETGAVEPTEVAAIAADTARAAPVARLESTGSGTDLLDATTSLTAGMALFFVFFTAGLPLLSILEERSQGTLARLLVAPVPGAAITAGKVLAAVLLGTLSLAALMVASTLLMGADWGPPPGALLLAVSAVLAAAGIMSLAAGAAKTPEQAGSAQGIVAVVLALLGGAFVPVAGTESALVSRLQDLTPHGWFLEGLARLRSDGVGAALPAAGVLVAIGVVTGLGGLWLSRTVLRR